jgi:hypothetical protein
LPLDKETVDAMIAAIRSGRTNQQTQIEVYQALRGNPHAIDPLFALLSESNQPEVWYAAAEILTASGSFDDAMGEKVWDRILRLSGEPKYRIQMDGSHTLGYEEELSVLGDDAFEFLVPLLEYRVWQNVPSIYSCAADMLAKLGDRRAVSLLVRCVEDHFRHGKLESPDTAYGAAQLVKAINELTGENFGGLGFGPTVTGDEVQACNWTEVRHALAAYLDGERTER